MAKSLESRFSNVEIGSAFSGASKIEGLVLPDGNGLKITPKSAKSTWSELPGSFESDDKPKDSGPHAGNWVLWTPSTAIEDQTWSLLSENPDDSALIHVMNGSLQYFARGSNAVHRKTTKISKAFADQKAITSRVLALASAGVAPVDVEHQAHLVVRAAIPEGNLSDAQLKSLEEQGAVFIEKVIHLGGSACQTLLVEAE